MSLALADLKIYHDPVMVKEVLEALQVHPGGKYIDCTTGEGGHTEAILEAEGRVLGLDADAEALKTAELRLERFRDAFSPANASYVDMLRVAARHQFMDVDGILMDLGLSSWQLEGSSRGFSFQREEPLDMRFNSSEGIRAWEVVNRYSEQKLANLLSRYGEERRSARVAKTIVQNRPIDTSLHLAQVIEKALGRGVGKIHPATRAFQAIRIEVNNEVQNIQLGLKQAVELLVRGGRLVVISYHSLEDRVVKEFLRLESKDCICPPERLVCNCGHKATLRLLNKKVITPSPIEVMVNQRSRSARMRVAERV